MSKKKDIYREAGEIVEWIAYVKQEGKAYPIKIGKFSDWLPARDAAYKRFGVHQVVLVEQA